MPSRTDALQKGGSETPLTALRRPQTTFAFGVGLDSNCSSSISQSVATRPGATYLLTFDFSVRPGVEDDHLVVDWNGVTIFDRVPEWHVRFRDRVDEPCDPRHRDGYVPTDAAFATEGRIEVDSVFALGAELRSQGPARITDSVNPVRSGRKQR